MGRSLPFRGEVSLRVRHVLHAPGCQGPPAQPRGGGCSRRGSGSGGGRQPAAWRLDAGSPGSSRALSQELVNRPRTKSR